MQQINTNKKEQGRREVGGKAPSDKQPLNGPQKEKRRLLVGAKGSAVGEPSAQS